MIALFLLVLPAFAGALNEGILGRAWGSPPRPEDVTVCSLLVDTSLDRMSSAVCPETLGNVRLSVNFMYLDGALYGAILEAQGQAHCRELREIAGAAWGPGFPAHHLLTGPMDNWYWGYPAGKKPDYTAGFTWDRVLTCRLIVSEGSASVRASALLKAAKAEAAKGL